MAEIIVSPGVFQQESDQSIYTTTPQVVGAALVGPTVLGVPFVPTYVTNYNQFKTLYGETFKSGSYYYEFWTSLAAKEYFANGGQTMLVTRIISGSSNTVASTYASASVTAQPLVGVNFATGSAGTGSNFMTSSNQEVRIAYAGVSYRFISAPPEALPQDDVDGRLYYFVTGSTTLAGLTSLTASINRALSSSVASASVDIVRATGAGGLLILSGSRPGTYANGITLATGSANTFSTIITLGGGTDTAGSITSSFTLETLAWGDQMNNTSSAVSGALTNGSSNNIRYEVAYSDTGSGLFTLVIRRGDDNEAQKNILETWSNISLDPQLPNYVSRVIGDLKPLPDLATGVVTYSGSFANKSAYVRVASIQTPHADSLDNNGNFKTSQYGPSMPSVGSGSFDGSFSGGLTASNAAYLMNEAATTSNIQGMNPTDYINAFRFLTDKDNYQFNVLLAPGISLNNTAAANAAITTVENRGDAVWIADSGMYGTSIASAVSNAGNYASNYTATYYPWVQLFSSGLGKNVWCPPSTVLGGVLAFNDSTTAEWFAPAGLNRGGIPSVVSPERRVQQTDRDTLYNGRVNPLATFPGTGVCVWGQKTLQKKPTALDRLNVRRLLIALKGFIGGVARTLVFEQNTTVTRNRFLAQVNPYLSSVVQRQGLFAYKVVMDATNNTPDIVDRNQLVGQIYIQPTKTAEFVILNFNILPTGATFPA
jgi:hypothetical protein